MTAQDHTAPTLTCNVLDKLQQFLLSSRVQPKCWFIKKNNNGIIHEGAVKGVSGGLTHADGRVDVSNDYSASPVAKHLAGTYTGYCMSASCHASPYGEGAVNSPTWHRFPAMRSAHWRYWPCSLFGRLSARNRLLLVWAGSVRPNFFACVQRDWYATSSPAVCASWTAVQ